MAALLRSCSWHAERLWRRDHIVKTITFLTVTAHGAHQLFDTPCTAPRDISDVQAWDGLIADLLRMGTGALAANAAAFSSPLVEAALLARLPGFAQEQSRALAL